MPDMFPRLILFLPCTIAHASSLTAKHTSADENWHVTHKWPVPWPNVAKTKMMKNIARPPNKKCGQTDRRRHRHTGRQTDKRTDSGS